MARCLLFLTVADKEVLWFQLLLIVFSKVWDPMAVGTDVGLIIRLALLIVARLDGHRMILNALLQSVALDHRNRLSYILLRHKLLLPSCNTLTTGHHPELLNFSLQQPMILLHGQRLFLNDAIGLLFLLLLLLVPLGHYVFFSLCLFFGTLMEVLPRLGSLLFQHLMLLLLGKRLWITCPVLRLKRNTKVRDGVEWGLVIWVDLIHKKAMKLTCSHVLK